MAKGKEQESFEATWERCCLSPWSGIMNDKEWIAYNTSLIIARLKMNRDNCVNPHKIDLYNRRIAYIRMMLLLET